MKPTFSPALCLLALSLIPRLGQGEEPALPGAEVTIPYAELRSLLEEIRNAETGTEVPAPPLEATLTAARYLLDFSGSNPVMTADLEARTFREGWHALPLFGGDPRLESQETESGAASVVWREGSYALLAEGTGEFAAKLSLSLPATESWERGGGVRFLPMPAAVAELRVTGLPSGKALRIEGESPLRTGSGELVYALPGEKADWRLVLEDAAEEESQSPAQPSLWELHTQAVARFAEGRLQFRGRIQALADSGSGLTATLALPAQVSGVEVEGEDIEDWKLEPRGPERRALRIHWKTRDMLDRTFLLDWEMPQSPLAESWELAPPRVQRPEGLDDKTAKENATGEKPAAEESRTLMVVLPPDGLELSHPSLAPVVEVRQLPGWLREQLGTEDGWTAEWTGGDPIRLAAEWLPRLETAQATVAEAEFETRVVADGSMLLTANYTIQHGTPMDWQLDLPPIDQLLICEVDRRAVKPVQRGEGRIEFRLPTPGKEEDAPPSTRVKLCCSLKSEALDPVSGRLAIELPRTELYIHRLDWALSIPDAYEPTAVEGNVQISSGRDGADSPANLIRLEKELCRGERPAVEVFYQRRGLDSANQTN